MVSHRILSALVGIAAILSSASVEARAGRTGVNGSIDL